MYIVLWFKFNYSRI